MIVTAETPRDQGSSALVCPKCGGDTGVKDSRPNRDNTGIRRRRLCEVCGYRFTTWEMAINEGLTSAGLGNIVGAARDALDQVQSTIDQAKLQLSEIERATDLMSGRVNDGHRRPPVVD